jgi:hypothetical protein
MHLSHAHTHTYTSDTDLFTSQLGVETGQADGERLERREWVPVVHGEHVLRNLTKLQNHLLVIG